MTKDIAIVGMAGRFPEARNLDQFLRNLREGRDSVRPLSRSRIADTTIDPHESYQEIAYMEDIDKFDCAFFGISKGEARMMDPHHRLLLEVVYETFEHAGYDPARFRGSRTAVMVGDVSLQYARHAQDENDPNLITGSLFNAALAGHVARVFDLQGPALMVDTTCSSSLVAVHLAISELLCGNADQALACGARLLLFPWLKRDYVDLGIKSPDGKARAFSSDANGTGSGEAVVAVLLKPLERALADGDLVHAVIRASAVNQDGARSASLTAPSPESQTALLRAAWDKAGIDPRTITYVEAHGTGTRLGDPIEVDALNQAFGHYTDDRGFCAISSLKTQIGHTDTAAGIANLVKAVLALRGRELFANLHFREPNPFIDFSKGAVYVNTTHTPWETPAPARAGVTSLGLNGTNCHVVLEDGPPRPQRIHDPRPRPFLVSARTERALLARLTALQAQLAAEPELDLAAVSETLGAGRAHFPVRAAFVASDRETLLGALAQAAEASYSAAVTPAPVFLFSPDIRPKEALVARLQADHAAFREAYQACQPECERTRQFAFQYAFYQLLRACGLTTQRVAGFGIGKLVIEVILEKRRLAEALRAAAEFEAEALPADLDQRLQRFAEQQTLDQPAAFIEIGPEGAYSRHLRQLSGRFSTHALSADADSALPELLRELYLAGLDFSWDGLLGERPPLRAVLPSYPFEPTRCWIRERFADPAAPTRNFYRLSWRPLPLSEPDFALAGKLVALLHDGAPLALALQTRLEALGASVVAVQPGAAFAAIGNDYRIVLEDDASFTALAEHLAQRGQRLDAAVHLLDAPPAPLTSAELDARLNRGLFAQLAWFRAFDRALRQAPCRLIQVASGAHAVLPGELADPERAMACGPLRAARADYPLLRARFVDLAAATPLEHAVEQLLAELTSADPLVLSAWRERERLVQQVVPENLASGATDLHGLIRPEGVYLITGGGRGLGFEMACQIAESAPVQLILLGRGEQPQGAVETLRAKGAQVEYLRADLADRARVTEVMTELARRYPRLDGIVHAAGVPGAHRLSAHSRESFAATLAPKVLGSLLLLELAPPAEFTVYFSSHASLMCSARDADYSAANAFLDQLARLREARGERVLSIAWPRWRETGMAHRITGLEAETESFEAIDIATGRRAFALALGQLRGAVLFSRQAPEQQGANFFFHVDQAAAVAPAEPVVEAPSVAVTLVGEGWSTSERLVAQAWAEVLGCERLHRDDDFYELGGHSLNGASVIARLERRSGLALEFGDIFTHPTLARLAAYLDQLRALETAAEGDRITPVADAPDYPLSFGQHRLWVIEAMHERLHAYNINASLHLRGALDAALLERAFAAVVARHQALRTVFRVHDGQPRQLILATLPSTVVHFDLSAEPEPMAAAQARMAESAVTPFDLASGPLLRVWLMRLGPSEHVLTLGLHHIVGDAWSLGVFSRELSACYSALSAGQSWNPRPLKIQYRDYTAWSLARQDARGRDRAFWLEQLAGPLEPLTLPEDFVRPAVHSFTGSALRGSLAPELCPRLKQLARERRGSLFMVLTALVKTLMHRYTQREDILLGTTTAGRPVEELEDQIGFYVNLLALRDRLSGSDSFATVLDKVRQTTTAALDHQHYPFDKLVNELALPRETGRSPIFDVLVSLENTREERFQLGTLEAQPLVGETRASRFDLVFYFSEREGQLALDLEYRTDLYREQRIRAIYGHLNTLAAYVLAAPEQPIARAELLGEDERRLLLAQNDVANNYGAERSLVQVFEDQVAARPEAIALVVEGRQLSYAALNRRVNAVAQRLSERFQPRRGTVIGLFCGRDEHVIIGILAILKLGACYLPLDAKHPRKRLQLMLADSACQLVLTEPSQREQLDWLPSDQVFDLATVVEERVENPPCLTSGEDLAYVLFTSGSTGTPKGVPVRHRAAHRLVCHTNYMTVTPGDRMLQMASYGFDSSVWEIFGALLNGATLFLAQPEVFMTPALLGRFIREHAINVGLITTALTNKLIDEDPGAIGCFDTLLFGGEEASLRHIRTALAHRKHPESLVNAYGPTEIGCIATTHCVREIDPRVPGLPIGTPIANTRVYVLDQLGQLQPHGVAGEIFVGGDALTPGYLNRDQLNATLFIEDPFVPGQRLYATGDLGRWNHERQLEFLGRKDHQVQIRGYRVETGEIESRLSACPGVRQVAVTAYLNRAETYELAAYLTAAQPLEVQQLRDFLAETLPDYMIPQVFFQLESMPINTSGKVDKHALPDPRDSALEPLRGSVDCVAPQNPTEQLMVEIWRALLGREQIGIHDKCFEIGVDSIKAIQIVARLAQAGYELKVTDIFKYQTIARLASQVVRREAVTISSEPIVGAVPLTAVQRWFFSSFRPPYHFNQTVLLASRERLDCEAMRQALAALLVRHDALRMRYRFEGDQVLQESAELGQAPALELVELPSGTDLAAAIEAHGNALQASFDLTSGPLLKAAIYRPAEGDDHFGIAVHHLVVDGVSWRILLADLNQAYEQALAGQAIALAPKSHAFRDWSEACVAYAASPQLLEQRAYWLALAAVPRLDGATAEPVPSHALVALVDKLEPQATEALLTEVHKAYQTEINDLLLTALARALAVCFQRRELAILLEGHGREQIGAELDLSQTVGWFTSIFPVLLRLPERDTPADALKHVKEQLRAIPNKGVGFGILRYLTHELDQVDPRPDISFNYLGQVDSDVAQGRFRSAELAWGAAIDPEQPAHTDIALEAIVLQGCLRFALRYNPRRFSAARMDELLATYRAQLLALIEHCLDPLSGELTPVDIDYDGFDIAQLDQFLDALEQGQSA